MHSSERIKNNIQRLNNFRVQILQLKPCLFISLLECLFCAKDLNHDLNV